ncbi:MAG: SDR family NAD(P)-dependent oxidoreductase, partial [Bacteroidetes bacterium]|nr:SDR family NAD(P)-dependent oxidoreductase [Bacteroidota bacterium]
MTVKEKYGDWALITGASSGIGEEFARRLAKEKINLILVARRKERLEKLSGELSKAYSIETVVASVDLLQDDFLTALKEKVGKREVGILINNAGFGS